MFNSWQAKLIKSISPVLVVISTSPTLLQSFILISPVELDIDKEFVNKVNVGDIMIGGANFGCGSSREHAPIAIKESGISCVIAKSFARIFYRNAINIGLAILECPEASEGISDGDEVKIDFDSGVITNVTTGKEFKAQPFPPFIKDIINKNGLLNSIKG